MQTERDSGNMERATRKVKDPIKKVKKRIIL